MVLFALGQMRSDLIDCNFMILTLYFDFYFILLIYFIALYLSFSYYIIVYICVCA